MRIPAAHGRMAALAVALLLAGCGSPAASVARTTGLQPVGWLPDARLVASSTTGPSTAPQTGVVIVDPVSGTFQPVPSTKSTSTQILGVVTA